MLPAARKPAKPSKARKCHFPSPPPLQNPNVCSALYSISTFCVPPPPADRDTTQPYTLTSRSSLFFDTLTGIAQISPHTAYKWTPHVFFTNRADALSMLAREHASPSFPTMVDCLVIQHPLHEPRVKEKRGFGAVYGCMFGDEMEGGAIFLAEEDAKR